MESAYILVIDQSTSGTKALLFNEYAKPVSRSDKQHRQIYPEPGWVEHDPEEIYQNVLQVMGEVIQNTGIISENIKCLSITNQRETVLIWDRHTGKPVYNAIVWQCMRGGKKCNELKEKGYEGIIRQKTGLIIDPYFSASCLNWLLQHDPLIMKNAQAGKLLAGTIDTWLIWKLTSGKVHATDFSNACRTLLLNINTMKWDDEICSLFDVPVTILPELKNADEIFGYTDAEGIFKRKIPLSGVLGDSHGALFGQRCYQKGLSKITYGTGSSVMMNIGAQVTEAPEGLVTSVGYSIKGKTDYVFEGNIHSTGATIKWMADSLEILKGSAESESVASSVTSAGGVYFVPAFSGMGAPYWNNTAKAVISGIHGGTLKAHVVRAGLESIAYQVKDLIDLMLEKSGIDLIEVRADGGPTNNNFLMQFQSDMLNTPVLVSDVEEASALGAALAGGLGTGMWKDLSEIEELYAVRIKKIPQMRAAQRESLYSGWKKAVHMALGI